MLTLGF